MLNSQWLINIPYPEPNQFNYRYCHRFIKDLFWYGHLIFAKTFLYIFYVVLPIRISILVTFPVNRNILDLIALTLLGERHKLWNYEVPHSSFPSLLGPNIHLKILFSNILSSYYSLNVRYHISQPYSTTGNIVLYFICKFLERSREDKSFWTE